jgi:hypothetical protein
MGAARLVQFEFTFDEAGGELTIVLAGEPSAGDFHRLTASLFADPRFRSGLLHFVDCSGVDVSGPLPDLEDEIAPLIERDWKYPPRAVAIYAPDSRLFDRAVLARAHMGGSLANRQVFTDPEEARRWLAAQRP